MPLFHSSCFEPLLLSSPASPLYVPAECLFLFAAINDNLSFLTVAGWAIDGRRVRIRPLSDSHPAWAEKERTPGEVFFLPLILSKRGGLCHAIRKELPEVNVPGVNGFNQTFR